MTFNSPWMHTTTHPQSFCSEAWNRTTSPLLAYVTGVQGGGRGEMRNAKREMRNAKRDWRKREGNACMQAGHCFLPFHCDRACHFYFSFSFSFLNAGYTGCVISKSLSRQNKLSQLILSPVCLLCIMYVLKIAWPTRLIKSELKRYQDWFYNKQPLTCSLGIFCWFNSNDFKIA